MTAPMKNWKCPVCSWKTRQRAISVSHICPVRLKQPLPTKGKRKLPDRVLLVLDADGE